MKGSVRMAEPWCERVGLRVKDRPTQQDVRLVISQPLDAWQADVLRHCLQRGKTVRSKRVRCIALK